MRSVIPYGRQTVTDDDVSKVVEILKSDFLTQGPKIKEFESAFAKYVGANFAVAVSNGTAALHLSAISLGVEKGQKVITTPITFAATANCVKYCGGEVVFSDIDPVSYLLDIEAVEELLKNSKDREYVGIIAVDFSGHPVNLQELRYVADKYNLWIIEDACHAPGGFFIDLENKMQKCGNGMFADLSIFSFHPVKHIATGEGGMITTNDERLYKKLLTLRTHGITKEVGRFTNSVELAGGDISEKVGWPGWYMEMQELGYNYRLTDIQAALGLGQLNRADIGLKRRRHIAKTYTQELDSIGAIHGKSGLVDGHAYHLYVIECTKRLELYEYLRSNNIYSQVHYIPIHMMPYYQKLGWKAGDFPHAESYYSNCLSLPMFPSLTDEEQEFVIEKIKNFFS